MKASLLLLLGWAYFSLPMSAQPSSLLSTHRWEHRLLLIFAAGENSPLYQQQIAEAQQHQKGWQDRDLQMYHLWPGGGMKPDLSPLTAKESQQLYRQYGIQMGDFTAILIGKDGGEKDRKTDEILSANKLFPRIDAMPMRQAEMKRKDGNQ